MADTKAITIPIEAKDRTKKGLDDTKKSVDGFFKSLKGGLGEESAFGNAFKLLNGAGAVAGLALAGRELNKLADKAAELNKEYRDGSKSAGEVAEELAKSLPVFGEVIAAGRTFRGILDGTADQAAQIANETKAVTAAMEAQKAVAADRKKNTDDYLASLRQISVEIGKLQRQDPDRTVFGIREQTRDDLDASVKDFAARRAKVLADYEAKAKESTAAINAVGPGVKTKLLGTDETEESKAARRSFEQTRITQQKQLEVAKKAKDDALKDLDREEAATRSALASRGAFREKDFLGQREDSARAERRKSAEESAKELTDAYRDARSAALRDAGRDLDADLDEAAERLNDRLKKIRDDAARAAGLYAPDDKGNRDRTAGGAAQLEALAQDKYRREKDAAKLAEIERNNALVRPAVESIAKGFISKFGSVAEVLGGEAPIPPDLFRRLNRTFFPKLGSFPDDRAPVPFTTATAREARFLTGAGAADSLGREQLNEAKRTNQLLAQIINRPSVAPVPIFPN